VDGTNDDMLWNDSEEVWLWGRWTRWLWRWRQKHWLV